MPAAGIDAERRQWRTKAPGKSKAGYLFNHTALAKVFSAKMLAGIAAAGLALPARLDRRLQIRQACAHLSGPLPLSRRHPRARHPRP